MSARSHHLPAEAVITSLTNPKIKAIRALDMRKTRTATGQFVAEGAAVLMAAAEQDVWPETVVALAGSTTSEACGNYIAKAKTHGASFIQVSEAVLGKLSHKDNPQTMLGVFRQLWCVAPTRPRPDETRLALEEVRDPGNLGSIIRTADATAVAGIILVGATCDPWSRECVRATMGSIFAVPLVRMDRATFLDAMSSWPGDTVGTHLNGTTDFRKHQYCAPSLIVMGGEGPGLSGAVTKACKSLVRIPMAGRLDSLNLAVATALMLYQIQGPRLTTTR